MNQEELFKPDPTKPIERLPEGTIDDLQPFESVEFKPITSNSFDGNKTHYIAGIDPYKDLVNEGSYAVLLKEGEGEDKGKLIAEYLGRENNGKKWEVPFPELVKQMQFYSTNMIVEEKQRAYVGIDNGVSGSIGIIYEDGTYEFFKTPVLKAQDYTKTKKLVSRIQPLELKKILSKIGAGSMVMIERPMINSTRFNASMSAIRAFEATITILETLGLPYQIEDSKAWQKALLPIGVTGEDLKTASKDVGNRMFPKTKEVKHPDCDGMLIAQYCKSKFR